MKNIEQKNLKIEKKWIKQFEKGLLVNYLEGKGEYVYVSERNPKPTNAEELSRFNQNRSHILFLVEVLNAKYRKEWNLTHMIGGALVELKSRDLYVFLDVLFVFIRHCAFSKKRKLSFPQKTIDDLEKQFKYYLTFLQNQPIEAFCVDESHTDDVKHRIRSLQDGYEILYKTEKT